MASFTFTLSTTVAQSMLLGFLLAYIFSTKLLILARMQLLEGIKITGFWTVQTALCMSPPPPLCPDLL
jgi:hypothetical protein